MARPSPRGITAPERIATILLALFLVAILFALAITL